MHRSTLATALALVMLAGCYHATVETGRTPSPLVIEEPFASSWVYGLVPPETVEAAARCPNGVARVETQLSFVNQLVGILTIGIYTPMSIRVTCAAADEDVDGTPAIELDENATSRDIQDAFSAAADLTASTSQPAYVHLGVRQDH